jgi:tetratricopeptide (TPR) repeat protein
MKSNFIIAWVLMGALAGARQTLAQSPSNPPASPTQSKPADQQKPSGKQNPAPDANAFPEDSNSVPVLPANSSAAEPDFSGSAAAALPAEDVDPVRSPEEPPPAALSGDDGSSSSLSGLDRLAPPPDADTNKKGNKAGNQPAEHKETVAEDLSVGTYYLGNKNWKAAQSRFESAMILDPENPDVYWGLAEAQRHLGNVASAKANYLKVLDYDPDGKHGKEARKALKDPALNAAPTASATHP